jgi:hypothetical protein
MIAVLAQCVFAQTTWFLAAYLFVTCGLTVEHGDGLSHARALSLKAGHTAFVICASLYFLAVHPWEGLQFYSDHFSEGHLYLFSLQATFYWVDVFFVLRERNVPLLIHHAVGFLILAAVLTTRCNSTLTTVSLLLNQGWSIFFDLSLAIRVFQNGAELSHSQYLAKRVDCYVMSACGLLNTVAYLLWIYLEVTSDLPGVVKMVLGLMVLSQINICRKNVSRVWDRCNRYHKRLMQQ